MSIEPHPGRKLLVPPPSQTWGELTPEGEAALVVRFILAESVVTIPVHQFKRWEHVRGAPETLAVSTGEERIVIEGRELGEVRAALDLGRLCELRANYPRASGSRPGPQVRRITIEPD